MLVDATLEVYMYLAVRLFPPGNGVGVPVSLAQVIGLCGSDSLSSSILNKTGISFVLQVA